MVRLMAGRDQIPSLLPRHSGSRAYKFALNQDLLNWIAANRVAEEFVGKRGRKPTRRKAPGRRASDEDWAIWHLRKAHEIILRLVGGNPVKALAKILALLSRC